MQFTDFARPGGPPTTAEIVGGPDALWVRNTHPLEDEQITLTHGCVSCTLREDVLPTLARLARTHPGRDLLLMPPEVIEPETIAAACAHCLVDGVAVTDLVRVDSYVTVVDLEHLLDGLASTDDLRDAMDDAEAFAELEHAAETGTQQFVARLEPQEAPKMGQKIDLAFKTEQMHFFDIETGQALR